MTAHMTQSELWAILKELPESQRRNAAKRIIHADKNGWCGIGIWEWKISRKHEADLVGIAPSGDFAFLHWQDTPIED